MKKRISDLVDCIAASSSRGAVEFAFRQFCNSVDTDLFAYVIIGPTNADVVSTYPAAWRHEYAERRLSRIDPVMAQAKRYRNPFNWSAETFRFPSKDESMIIQQASEFGIRAGISIPVDLPFGTFAMFTLATDKAPSGIDFTRHISSMAIALCLAGEVLSKERQSHKSALPVALTVRQVQCLRWASLGRSAKETAHILGISEEAVSFHRKNARQRLNAKSTSEAVRLACDAGILA
ncbi:hypothetical protein GOZ90_23015 [Agrobacterium vitis]|uniref:HTH luxR-type domain-containing protein n=1 Tax=Agrobacterium vitis TaxID=373 RepID=A0A6L6VIU7_AGRVI|nr:autoinducer binding domain-containing protein [Agrobacterium vitis]MUZ75546.1 hypothetical protein [Agrobacterium vitis]